MCWKRRLPTTRGIDSSGCQAIARHEAGQLIASHRLKFAQGPWGSRPLMYCTSCGHYSTTRIAQLRLPCQGKVQADGSISSAYRLYARTIRRGRHPTLKRFVLGHRYTPHCQWEGRGPEAELAQDHAAAQQSVAAAANSPAELHELLELEQLEQEAALAGASWEFEDADPFAEGEGGPLGFDSP
jgi:hypothetical protein